MSNRSTASKSTTGVDYPIWGLTRSAESAASVYDARHHPHVARVLEHLGLNVIELRAESEPVQWALGEQLDPQDPDARARRVTPFFSTVDALDFFCRLNLSTYLDLLPGAPLPRRWFWQSDAHSSIRVSAPRSVQ